jgi:hypothetical protein
MCPAWLLQSSAKGSYVCAGDKGRVAISASWTTAASEDSSSIGSWTLRVPVDAPAASRVAVDALPDLAHFISISGSRVLEFERFDPGRMAVLTSGIFWTEKRILSRIHLTCS